eukprot:g2051.t1
MPSLPNLEILQLLAQSLNTAVLITDARIERPGPFITFANQAFAEMSGYSVADVIGQSPRFLQKGVKRTAQFDEVGRTLKHGRRYFGVLKNVRANGEEYFCEVDIRPLRDGTDLQHVLDIAPENIVGTCIDRFHKNPAHQRTLLSNAANLPFETQITLGDEYVDLNIFPILNSKGKYTKAALVWAVVTEKVRAEQEQTRLLQMIDKMPINVMTCDPQSFEINYVNQTSIDTLTPLEQHLPIKAADLLGQCIDIFHKHPEHQRKLLADPSNLPWRANIRLGPEVLRLDISAISDDRGAYLGPMLTWSVISDQVVIAEQVTEVVGSMNTIADGLVTTSSELITIAESAKSQSTSVTSAAEEMTASIAEISERMNQAADISKTAISRAEDASTQIGTLKAASEQIGSVMGTIQAIADQTKLLALNATIEAARAGEAGRGFAVVAAEVKELSEQTTAGTDQIRSQIEAMQHETSEALKVIQSITSVITELDEHAMAVAGAMTEQQSAAAEVARAISGVSEASESTETSARSIESIVRDMDTVKAANEQIQTFLNKK